METITPRNEAFKKITESLAERLQETLKAIEEIQKGLFLKYRTAKEDLEKAYLELTVPPEAKEVIEESILYYNRKLRLLNKYSV